jgi:hypothetical protein
MLDKEAYRKIVEAYFAAFRNGDFSKVSFSSRIEFLSPISGNTFKGVEEVTNFLTNVCTRVTEVNILATTIDYPTASGVWQMRTSKGTLYTLHNFFRLDDQGLSYIWPMFDPKAVMDDPPGLLSWLTGKGY